MSGRRRESLERSRAKVDVRRSVLIVCEGEKTEYFYFRSFRAHENVRLISVDVVHTDSDPVSVVERAISRRGEAAERALKSRDANERIDEVWCVIDVDEHAGLEAALTLAAKNRINIAVSNPCFELWILLHVCDHRAYIKAHRAKKTCKSKVPKYDGSIPFLELWPYYPVAVERAKKLDNGKTIPNNPGTRVYILTERLRELGRKRALARQLRTTGRM